MIVHVNVYTVDMNSVMRNNRTSSIRIHICVVFAVFAASLGFLVNQTVRQVGATPNGVNRVALGDNNGCGLRDGFLYCWGQGAVNQIGDSTVNNAATPKFVPSWSGFTNNQITDIAAGRWGTCVVRLGVLYCWGRSNSTGQFGNNDSTDGRVVKPTAMANGTGEALENKTVTRVSQNVNHTCVIASGSVYCMGVNDYGQLGDGTTTTQRVPTLVSTVTGGFQNGMNGTLGPVTDISVGDRHTCAVEAGIVYCWGWNDQSRLGNASAASTQSTPFKVATSGAMLNAGNVTSVSAGIAHTCAIESTKVYCWGSRVNGRLTGATTGSQATPIAVADNGTTFVNTGITQVSAGIETTCVLKSGSAYCWGRQQHGQLGNGLITDAAVSVATPVLAGAMTTNSNIDHIDQSNNVSEGAQAWRCAARQARFYCWGQQQFNNVFGNNSVSGTTVTSTGTPVQASPTWPVVSSVSPSSGRVTGGTAITITGLNFQAGPSVMVGGSACVSVVVVSVTSITCTTPAGSTGAQDIVITNSDTQFGSGAGVYAYNAAPTVSSISPVSGPVSGGTLVSISGTDFVTGAAVTVGGSACTSVVVVSATSITCSTSTGSSGQADVVVTNPDTQSGTGAGLFTFIAPPTVSSISPASGVTSGGVNVTITGSGFLSGATVVIGGSTCTSVNVVSLTSITCTTATAAVGTGDIVVTNLDGQSGSLSNGFSVTATTTTTTTTAATTATSTTTTVPKTTTATTVPVSATNVPSLVTPANQAQLEADPGEAVAIINGKEVQVETLKVETANATPDALKEVANEIVNAIEDALPKGVSSGIAVVNTAAGAELSGLMVNPDDPKEKLNVPVESVTLLKAGDSAILISALNQTNLPAEVASGGILQVTRGGLVAATAYGLPGSETGEIVLMSTPRLLQTFTVGANGSYKGQVPLPKDIAFGSHTVVMATKNAKVSLGIKLVRTRMQFRIKRKISSRIFLNRAGVVKVGGGKITVKGAGRCRANSKRVIMAAKPGGCYITVRQAAKGANKAIYYRFTVSVVKKLPKKAPAKTTAKK